MDTQKAQIVDRLKQANNILITVSANPTVDQLSAAIGTALLLNKLGKHATAVFSGTVPSIIEFLEPSKTLETNTDSLRDFIISLDKNKADKLRYKVENDHVRIFITPYRTSISDKDLVFSQGDFNVEVVLALGVTKQQDLDKAIAAHGRILHDATVVDISTSQVSGMGAMNLIDPKASSLCEIMVDIGTALKPDVLDMQMATAFLTGIVAQTNRFSNEKTTSSTMEVSSKLLAAGANQQLVATKLQPPKPVTPAPANAPQTSQGATTDSVAPAAPSTSLPEPVSEQPAADGSLQIDHGPVVDLDNYEITNEDPSQKVEQIRIDDQGQLKAVDEDQLTKAEVVTTDTMQQDSASTLQKLEPPTTGGTLTASGIDNEVEPAVDALGVSGGATPPLLSHDSGGVAPAAPSDTVGGTPVQATNTLEDIERSVQSPHLGAEITVADSSSAPVVPKADIDDARDAVSQAMSVGTNQPLPPIEALGAQYVDLPGVGGEAGIAGPVPAAGPSSTASLEPVEPATTPPAQPQEDTSTPPVDPTAPPPVPPPMMPPAFTPSA